MIDYEHWLFIQTQYLIAGFGNIVIVGSRCVFNNKLNKISARSGGGASVAIFEPNIKTRG